MKMMQLKGAALTAAMGLLFSTSGHAGGPLWVFSAPTPNQVMVSSNRTAPVQYTVTNQSSKSKNLILKPRAGLSASSCHLAGKGSTCTLTLTVNGSSIPLEGIHAGPVLCEEGNLSQCYQPAAANQLNITRSTGPITTYAVTASGDAHASVAPASQLIASGGTGTINLTVASGYTASIASDTCGGSLSGTTYTTGPVTANCSVRFSSSIQQLTVSASGDSDITVNAPISQQVNYGSTATFSLSLTAGYSASVTGCGVADAPVSGTSYTTGAITSACSLTFSSTTSFPISAGPTNVFAVPGNGQAVISWAAPGNTGTGTVTGYTVTYGPTSATTFTTPGCTATAPSLTCTVTGLNNNSEYTFAVSAVTKQGAVSQTGLASLSSPITPTAGLSISPSTLALSSVAGSNSARIITLTNNSASPITLTAVPTSYSDFTPNLPSDVTIVTTCSTGTPLAANGGSCTLTITPGVTASSACTGGNAPAPSAFEVVSGSSIKAVVLGYGCIYQGGYVFSIDDTTPNTGSIGGKVVATTDQAPAYPNGIAWSPSGVYDSIWGIDDASTSAAPSPNASSTLPATFKTDQLNCDAVNDGICATHNIQVFYSGSPLTSYAAGLCRIPLTGANGATGCAGGSTCHTDWYLPSACELGPFGSTGVSTGNYPSLPGSQTCTTGSTNIQNQLISTSIASIANYYWSSTEFSDNPRSGAWDQKFAPIGGDSQGGNGKVFTDGVRCVRALTL